MSDGVIQVSDQVMQRLFQFAGDFYVLAAAVLVVLMLQLGALCWLAFRAK